MEHRRTVGFELRTLHNRIKRYVDNMPHKKEMDNITGMHGWVIGYLYDRRDEDVFQRDLEEEFHIRRSTATEILKLMEKNGLITKETVSCDARLKKLVLTDKAERFHLLAVSDFEKFEQKLTDGIEDSELEAFFATIQKLKNNIEGI